MTPYIGITDFTNFEQVEEMLAVFKMFLSRRLERQLHVGVMMSYKTLHGLTTKWLNVLPPKESIAGIFSSDEAYNCLHYADSDNDPALSRSLSEAIFWGGMGIHAVQLDMVWPDPEQVARGISASHKRLEVILQIGQNAFEQVQNNPQVLIEKLRGYEGVIHRVLLDKSMGRGIGMDAVGLIPFARAIKNHFPDVGLGAAGGLGPNTLYLVEPLIEVFPDLSIDAQGKLRPSGNALDPIDWNMARNYLGRFLNLLSGRLEKGGE